MHAHTIENLSVHACTGRSLVGIAGGYDREEERRGRWKEQGKQGKCQYRWCIVKRGRSWGGNEGVINRPSKEIHSLFVSVSDPSSRLLPFQPSLATRIFYACTLLFWTISRWTISSSKDFFFPLFFFSFLGSSEWLEI